MDGLDVTVIDELRQLSHADLLERVWSVGPVRAMNDAELTEEDYARCDVLAAAAHVAAAKNWTDVVRAAVERAPASTADGVLELLAENAGAAADVVAYVNALAAKPEPQCRWWALQIARATRRQLGLERTRLLLELAGDSHPEVRYLAISQIGAMLRLREVDLETVKLVLHTAASDADASVRRSAERALRDA